MKIQSVYRFFAVLLCFATLHSNAVTFIIINEGTGDDTYALQAMPDGTYLSGMTGLLHAGGTITLNYSWSSTPSDTTGFQNTDGDLGTMTQYGWDRNSCCAQFDPVCYCYTNSSDAAVITVEIGVPVAACFTNVTYNFKNTDTVGHRYRLKDSCDNLVNPPGGVEVDSGASTSLSLNVPCTNAACVTLQVISSVNIIPDGLGDGGVTATANWGDVPIPPSSETPGSSGTPGASTPDSAAPQQGTGGAGGLGGVGQYNPTNSAVSGTNSPILFTATNGVGSIQQGDAALYAAVVNGFDQTHGDLQTLESDVVTGLQYVAGALQGVTNGVSTNGYGYMAGLLPASSTNGDAALTAGTNADSLGAVGTFLGSMTPTLPGTGGGAPSAMTFEAFGYTLNFNPVSMFPGVASFSLMGWEVMLSLWFLYDISRLFWELVRARSAARTGGVPNMDFAGFNIVGVVISVAAPAIVIALFSAAMIYLFSQTSAYVTAALSVSGWSSAMGDAYYLLVSFFPVNFFFGIMFARIVITMTLSQIYAGASSAARFILNGG